MSRSFLIKTVLLLIAVSALFVSACSMSPSVTTTTFQLNDDGSVTHTIIDTSSVDKQSLESYIDDALANYNKDSENPSVVLDSLSVNSESSEIKIVMKYDSVADYASFNNLNAFSGTLTEALKAGYSFEGDFTTAAGISVLGYTLPAEYADLYVLILNEPMNVIIKDKNVYCTGSAVINEDGSYTINESTDSTLPDVFRTTNKEYSYFIY